MNQTMKAAPDQVLTPATPRPASVQKTTREEWKGLWHAFRGMRHLLGEQVALTMIEQYCKREAAVILQVIL